MKLEEIAALFDERGTITISVQNARYLNNRCSINSGKSKHPLYHARVEYRSKTRDLPEQIREILGCGTISHMVNHNWPHYSYMAWHHNAEIVLRKLIPYLSKKNRDKAVLILKLREIQNFNRFSADSRNFEFDNTYLNGRKFRTIKSNTLDPEIFLEMESLYSQIKAIDCKKAIRKSVKELVEI